MERRMSAAVRRPAACRLRERGAVLFVALVVLVLMSYAAVSVVRSMDTSNLIAGNLAFKQATMQASDRAITDALNNLANALSDIPASYGEAEFVYQEAIRIFDRTLDPGHLEIANTHSNLGSLYVKTGAYEKAAAEYVQALRLREPALGPDHPNTIASRMGVARKVSTIAIA